jgi:hypothetical protein
VNRCLGARFRSFRGTVGGPIFHACMPARYFD